MEQEKEKKNERFSLVNNINHDASTNGNEKTRLVYHANYCN